MKRFRSMIFALFAAMTLTFGLAWNDPGVGAVISGGSTITLISAQDDTNSRIADAMSAGPASIVENATILDWPEAEGAEMTVLREGTNGWVCVASSPKAVAAGLQDPACLDEVWQGWFEAFMNGETPTVERIGISYMLAGDAGAGNVDPFATGPEDDPTWHVGGPHLMILMPDHNYEGVSTDYENGEPYVMWAGTPYAHIMVPVAEHEEHQ